MNETEYLLTVVAEECAEIAQRAAKAARFGLEQIQDSPTENPDGLTNRVRIVAEYNDLIGTLQMLGLDVRNGDLQQAKKRKVRHYMTAGPTVADRGRLAGGEKRTGFLTRPAVDSADPDGTPGSGSPYDSRETPSEALRGEDPDL